MMGSRQEAQASLFYEFSLEDHVPQGHLLRSIDRFVDLSGIRAHLANFYSHTGRPSIDPDASRGLLFRHSLRAAALRGSTPEPRLTLVLSPRPDRPPSRSLNLFQEQTWTLPRE